MQTTTHTIRSRHATLTLDGSSGGAIRLQVGEARFDLAPTPWAPADIRVAAAGDELSYRLPELRAEARWRAIRGGFLLTLDWSSDSPLPAEYPGRVLAHPGDELALPIGEGLLLRVEDREAEVLPQEAALGSCPRNLRLTALLRSDAYLALAPSGHHELRQSNPREEGLLQSRLAWLPRTAGRRVEMALLLDDHGGLAAMAHAYRELRDAGPDGPVQTLTDKLRLIPNLALLAGAPSFWLWHDDYEQLMYGDREMDFDAGNAQGILDLARELRQAGLDHALINLFFGQDLPIAETIARETGFLVAKYDNLEDELPGDIAHLIPEPRLQQCDYTQRLRAGWPDDIVLNPDGIPATTWALRGTDGVMHPQHHLCPTFAPAMVRRHAIPLARRHGASAWFLDVLGCGDCQCHHPRHPLASALDVRNEALQELNRAGLISGTEEGVEAYIGSYCYCEGRMSPQRYRIDYQESGRRKAHLYTPDELEPAFSAVMLNHQRRIPLWELIYHDCAVAYWYWGDSSNSCPWLLGQRNLLNCLTATPPLYSLHNSDWPRLRNDILSTCRQTAMPARLTAFARMTGFDWLTADRSRQRTTFDNGVAVTVDFAEGTAVLDDGATTRRLL